MARFGDTVVLVEIKGVDAAYPLYGEAVVENTTLQAALAPAGGLPGAVADRVLFERLRAAVGDVIQVGEGRFRLTGVLLQEPDRVTDVFALGPRIMVGAESFKETGLVRPGSLFRAEYLLRLPADKAKSAMDTLRRRFPESGWRVRDYTDAAPGIRTMLDRLRVDLTLVGLAALLTGGLGIAGGVRGYLEGRLAHIAAMKCMGGSTQVLFVSYLLQILALGAVGTGLGLAGGGFAPWILKRFGAELLPIHIHLRIYTGPLVQAVLFGLVTTLAFALPPLFRAVLVRPSGIFRGYVSENKAMPPVALAFSALFFVLFAGMIFLFTGDFRLSSWFVGGVVVAWLLFKVMAEVIRRLARNVPPLPWPGLRVGMANIHRPGSPGVSLVFALGFGLTALTAVTMVNAALHRSLSTELAEQAPVFFFMDIRPQEVEDFRTQVLSMPGVGRLDLRPMIRGHITAIKDVPVEKAVVSEEVRWAVRGDRGLSYGPDFPAGNTLLRGTWWEKDYAGPPLISLTSDLARGFDMDIGDRLSLNVLGRTLTGTVANIRDANWQSLAMQFAIIFSPGVLESAPQNWLGAVYDVDQDELLFRRVTDEFPDVAVVSVREVLENAAAMMRRMARIFQVMAGLALVVGFLVLAGAFSADQHRRIYDSVVYKVCGATRRDILMVLVAEFSLAGLFAGFGGLVLGTLAAWGVVRGLLHLPFRPDLILSLFTVSAGTGISLFTGLLGTWRALGREAAPLLRNE
jgi:putative ABC transport system permease protein